MAIPLSNEMREVQAPRTAELKPIDNQQFLQSMGNAALGMNRQMQETIRGGFKAAQQIRDQQDAFKRNEAERIYNERTTELNTQLAQKQGEERVKFQPKYEAEMKLASDTYEAAINKVHNFEIREGSKRSINAWNNRNASNYQYANYQNETNLQQSSLAQTLIDKNRQRVQSITGAETPSSLVATALNPASGYDFAQDAEKIRQFYGLRKGEPAEVVEERVKDYQNKAAQAMAIRYAQLAKKNSPSLDYKDAESVYNGILKGLGIEDGFAIEGRRVLQQAKIDAMAKDPYERALLMTDGQFDLGKAHYYAPDLSDEERQKALHDANGSTRSRSGNGGSNTDVSAGSAEEYFVNVADLLPSVWDDLPAKGKNPLYEAVSGTDWGTKYGEYFDPDARKDKRKAIDNKYTGNRATQLTRLLELEQLGADMLASGNLKEQDKQVVQHLYNALSSGLTDAVNTKDFEVLLGNDEARRNLPSSTNLQLTAIENAIKKQGGSYQDWKLFSPSTWGKSNTQGKMLLDQRLVENALRDSRYAYADTIQMLGQDPNTTQSKEWWMTPQSVTISGTTTSTDNITGEKKSVTTSSPQQVQVIPMQLYAQTLLARQANSQGQPYMPNYNQLVNKASRPVSEWAKGEQDLYKGLTGYKTEEQEFIAKLRNQSQAEARAEMQRSYSASFISSPASYEAAIKARGEQIFKEKILNNPGMLQAARIQIQAKRKADTEIQKQMAANKQEDTKQPQLANLSDLGLHGNIAKTNSKPTILADNSVRMMELDNILYSAGFQNISYTSAMGGKHAEGEKSHAAGHKIDFVTANGQRLPAELEQALERAGFWGKGTGAVGWEVNPKTGRGHYDVSIATPKGYKVSGQLMADIAFKDTPLNLTLNDKDTPKETRYKNIFMDYRMGYGQNGTMTLEEFKHNYMGTSAEDSEDYSNYLSRRNTDRQTQEMYNSLFADVDETNISMLPHVFDISQNPSLKDIVDNKYREYNMEPAAGKYVKYISNDEIFSLAEGSEVGYGEWAGKKAGLYEQALQFPKELRRNRALFLTDSDKHYYYDGYQWNMISGNPGRIIGFMGVLDQNDDLNPNSTYSILSNSLSSLEFTNRNNASFMPAYNVTMGDEPVQQSEDNSVASYKNVTTSDWRR